MARRRPALVLALLLAGAAGLAPPASAAPTAAVPSTTDATAQIAPSPTSVQLRSRPLRITPAGSVRVVMWVRCIPGIQHLGISVGVYQGSVYGGETVEPPADEMPVCDGQRQRFVVSVPRPETGRFHAGQAQIEVYMAAYNPATQTDADSSDGTFARLYRPGKA